jgi:hypothetical protein
MALCLAQTGSNGLLYGVTIVDGPPIGNPSDQLLLFVGDSPTSGAPGALGTQDFAGMPARERDESFSVYCTAYARSGDTALKPERDRAFSIMGAVERLVRPSYPGSDITLGGAVSWCSVSGRIAYTPGQSENGAIVRLAFEVICRERLSGS